MGGLELCLGGLNPATGLGTRRDKHTRNLESNSHTGTLLWKVFIASQGHWKWSDNTWKREVFSESMTKFSYIQFLYETRLYRGNEILEILYSRLKQSY